MQRYLSNAAPVCQAATLSWAGAGSPTAALPKDFAITRADAASAILFAFKHDETAIRNIRRYLSIAQRLVENAGKCEFPGKEFNY